MGGRPGIEKGCPASRDFSRRHRDYRILRCTIFSCLNSSLNYSRFSWSDEKKGEGKRKMLTEVLWIGLCVYAIHFVVQVAYTLWRAHRNDALPRLRDLSLGKPADGPREDVPG